jgi:hypothetical protein
VLVTCWPSRILTICGPRIDERLVAAISRLDDPTLPIAEGLGLIRPSYQQVRVIVHQLRSQYRSPRLGAILLDISYGVRPPQAIYDLVTGDID